MTVYPWLPYIGQFVLCLYLPNGESKKEEKNIVKDMLSTSVPVNSKSGSFKCRSCVAYFAPLSHFSPSNVGEVHRLIIGPKAYGTGKWVITKLSNSLERTDGRGNIIAVFTKLISGYPLFVSVNYVHLHPWYQHPRRVSLFKGHVFHFNPRFIFFYRVQNLRPEQRFRHRQRLIYEPLDIIIQERILIDESAKQNVPRYAQGVYLDSLAEIFKDAYRLQPQAAATTFRFYLSTAPRTAPRLKNFPYFPAYAHKRRCPFPALRRPR